MGDAPYYSYAVQTSNEDQSDGNISLIHSRECSHVILHEHPLPYSRLDTLLRRRLEDEARLVVTFDPGSVGASAFDPMDAYYIPLAGWDPAAAGPRIEVWDVHQYHSETTAQSANSLLSLALSMEADAKAHRGDRPAARVDVARALSLEPGNTHALEILAGIERDTGDLRAAASAYLAILKMNPEDSRALEGLALLSVQQGDHARAIKWYNRARRRRPRDASLLNNLAASYRVAGHPDTARALWREAVSLREDYADVHFNLGTALYLDGESDRALPHLRRAVELAPDSAKYHSNAAAAHRAAGMPRRAVAFWQSAIRVDSSYVDAYFNMAYTLQYDLRDSKRALHHWEMARELTPADADVIMHGAQAAAGSGARGRRLHLAADLRPSPPAAPAPARGGGRPRADPGRGGMR
jgi:tetratricopeptide (TPR) repeat protein